VLSVLLALSLAAPSSVWVAERASEDPRCTGAALATAIQALLPETEVRVGAPPAPTGLQVTLTESPQGFTLSVTGGPAPFTRVLPEKEVGQCAEAVNLSALIVSRGVDELPWRASAPEPPPEPKAEVRRPAEPSLRFATDVGIVATGIAGGISPGLTLDLGLRAGPFFFLVAGDLLLAQHPPIDTPGIDGTWVVQSDPVEAVVGASLRSGPGDGSFGLGGGAMLTSVSVQSTTLPRITPQFAAEPFVCLWLGYALRLPWHLLAGLRFEERWMPSPTRFTIEAPSTPTLESPQFSAALSLLIGRDFY
jgi:hypothetical protein